MDLRTLTAPMGTGVYGVLVDHPGGPTVVLNDQLPIGEAPAVAAWLMTKHHSRYVLASVPVQQSVD
jgi:hypothetical protein